jgi:hypothetical protein
MDTTQPALDPGTSKKKLCFRCGKLMYYDEYRRHTETTKGMLKCIREKEKQDRKDKPRKDDAPPSKHKLDEEEKEWVRQVATGKR